MKNFREKLYTRQGSRFVPVHECRFFDALPEGAWLVIVGPGNTAIRRALNPAYAELEAAMRTAEDAMCTAMIEASKLRPREHEMSKKEQRAWAAYKEIMGDDVPRYLGEYASVQEIVQAGLDAIWVKIRSKNDRNVGREQGCKARRRADK